MMRNAFLALGLALGSLVTGQAAAASSYTFDISGLTSDGDFVDVFPTLTHDFGAAGTVVQVDFDVNYESFDPSWRSEVQIAIDTDDDLSFDADIDMFAFGAPDDPGVFSASGSITAASFSSNGLVYLTLWEFFDDLDITPDALFGPRSTVTVTYEFESVPVPEPSTLALCGIAALAGGLVIRRRRTA